MAKVAVNADIYASTRLNIFFPAHNSTSADGNLTGQCVTLNKWFLAEMTDVPAPFSARGHARYVGDTLVAQGHAVEVPYEQRRRGDFVVYKYGTYGHIGVLLSGDRIFEQNANVGGVARRVVDGAYVYASRIGSLGESWRPVRPNIYRIKSYTEDKDMRVGIDVGYDTLNRLHHQIVGNWNMSKEYWDSIQGRDFGKLMLEWSNHPASNEAIKEQQVGETAIRDKWDQQIYGLQDQVKARDKIIADKDKTVGTLTTQITELEKRPTTAQFEEVKSTIASYEEKAKKAQEELDKYKSEDKATENAVIAWLKALFRIGGK